MPAVIDRLPNDQRQKVIDALLAGQSLRTVAKLAGVHYTVVGDYKRRVLAPAVETARKLQAMQTGSANPVANLQQTVATTRQVLAADPLVAHIEEIENDLREGRGIAKNDRDVKALAAAARTELDAIKLTAELTGRKQADGSVQVVLLADNHTEQHIHIEQSDISQAAGVVDISPAPQD